jgi:hypothetical protein
MKRKLSAIMLVAALGLVPLAEAGATQAPATQEEKGTVLFPTPHPQDPNICFQGVARRVNMLSQGVVSGPFGAIFEVDKKTWNGKFALTGSGATGAVDLDIYFFDHFGDSIPDDPALNSPVITTQYQERNTDGEVGTIPPNTNLAIVCLYDGAGANFEYKASPPKVKKKKKK